ncbi:hypothetical protein DM860_016285 [Cuscuta australis]|uniref:Exonuclease domain-containing protein n=1 Tax=Cuscuta australis TaxID=267555 RepID=A0A328E682_9ASTE|nr:hypothetical protein DM860_016285 [Cuscuta australis]
MDALIASAKKDVLVHLVKLSQKRGMKGSKGSWKDFLQLYDKKFGSSMSDPARRSFEDLAAFLKTFSQDEDLKIFEKVLQCHTNRDAMIEFQKHSENCESPEQRLVCLTLNHPQYAVDYSLPSYEEGWLVTKCSKKSKEMKSTKMLAIDCEMALCNDGTEALIRVCVVDQNFKSGKAVYISTPQTPTKLELYWAVVVLTNFSVAFIPFSSFMGDFKPPGYCIMQVKLDKFVKPSKTITDYRTDITGINASDLDGVTCSLNDVQESMKKLLAHGKILVGHGLCNDLRDSSPTSLQWKKRNGRDMNTLRCLYESAPMEEEKGKRYKERCGSSLFQSLQIDHAKVIDTAYVFKYRDAPNRRPSLSNLCKFVLGYELRENGSPHNCLDDAMAAMKLVKKKVEHDCDDSIPFTPREEGGEEKDRTAKLLIHRIPVGIGRTDLHEIISGEFTVQNKFKPNRKQLDRYSAFAIFKNQQEANEAYEKLEGTQEKDTFGRPQKLVSFKLDTGVSGSLCVRKMACGNLDENPTAKRSLQDEEEPLEEKSKKVKTDHPHRDDRGEEELGTNNGSECGAHSAEIEQLKRELRQRDEEITSLNRIIVALVRKQQL